MRISQSIFARGYSLFLISGKIIIHFLFIIAINIRNKSSIKSKDIHVCIIVVSFIQFQQLFTVT